MIPPASPKWKKSGTSLIPVNSSLDVNVDSGTLFVDVSADRVGIGTDTPNYLLDVAGDINISTGSVFRIDGAQISSADLSDGSSLLKNVVEDTTPQLGGDLDVNGHVITVGSLTDISVKLPDDAGDSGFAVSDSNSADLFRVASDGGIYAYDTTIITASGLPLSISNTTDAVSNQALLIKGNNRATAATDDEAYLSLNLDDSAGATQEFARLTWSADDVTAGSIDGAIKFSVPVNGALTDILEINGNRVETLNSKDLRVTGSIFMNNTTIYGGWNASENLTLESTSDSTKGDVILQPNGGDVGIGTSTPDAKLHVAGSFYADSFTLRAIRNFITDSNMVINWQGETYDFISTSTGGSGSVSQAWMVASVRTGTTAGSYARQNPNSNKFYANSGGNLYVLVRLNTGGVTGNTLAFVGIDGTLMTSSNTTSRSQTRKHVGIFYEDGTWYASCADGTTQYTETISWSGNDLYLKIDGTTSGHFKIYNGSTLLADLTSNIPSDLWGYLQIYVYNKSTTTDASLNFYKIAGTPN